MEGFFKRHPELSTRSSRIFEANRVQADDEERLWEFYRVWNKYDSEERPALDRIWITDETGKRATRNQPSGQVLQNLIQLQISNCGARNICLCSTLEGDARRAEGP